MLENCQIGAQDPEFKNAATKVKVRLGSEKRGSGPLGAGVGCWNQRWIPHCQSTLQQGVSTIIYLHIDYGDLTKLRENMLDGNLVVMGHLAGDSIGLNGLADRLEAMGVETVRIGVLPSV
jgi:hypothetical protein